MRCVSRLTRRRGAPRAPKPRLPLDFCAIPRRLTLPSCRGALAARSALILSLLAIPLSFVNPRAGRSMNLVLALLIYMITAIFVRHEVWIAQSQISLAAGCGQSIFACCAAGAAVLPALMVFSVFRLIK